MFLIMLAVPALSSETLAENSMQLTIDIPEDYGIEVPKDVLRLDRFVFGYEIGGERRLVPASNLDLDFDQLHGNRMTFTLLFYGNITTGYQVAIATDPGLGWTRTVGGEQISIPMETEWAVSEDAVSGIAVNQNTPDGTVAISIPPQGPVQGIPVADVSFIWGDQAGMIPGTYYADISFTLSAI